MAISAPFILRPVATMLLTLGIVLLGLVSYVSLPVAALPSVDLPTIFVIAALPGAAPETMAASVATPLERQLGTIAGVTEMTSLSSVGNTRVIVQFGLDRNVDGAARDVQAAINAAQANLPKDLPRPPTYFKANPNLFPVITLALTSATLPAAKLYDYADTILAQKLAQIEGVAQVDISGAEKTAVRVQVNPGALTAMGLALEDVRTAIVAATSDSPKGSLEDGRQSWAIAADDQLFKAAAYRQIIVAWRNGAPVRLGDVATVIDSVANNKLAGWLDTTRSVIVQIRKQPDANTVAVVDLIKENLPQLRRWLPPSVQMLVTADRTASIRASLRDVQVTMGLTTVLVILVIALFLKRFWATVIPSITIPVSVCGTFVVMWLLGFTIDNLSMLALTISVGFVVDDAIVMIENIVRRIEAGEAPVQAALRGARQMGFTILSITVSLIAAMAPILFLPGVIGRFFREFSLTLATAIAVSAIISVTLTPMLCGRLLTADAPRVARPPTALSRLIDRLTEFYALSLERSLRYPWWMALLTLLIAIGTIYLYTVVPKGLFPTQDTGVIRATTDAPPDISFDAMADRQRAVADTFLADPAVANLSSFIGGSGWQSLKNGSLTVNLKPVAERKISVDQVMDRLRPKLAAIEGIDTYMAPVQDVGFGARAGKARYQYTMQGADLDLLEKWVGIMRERMRALPELTDIATDQDSSGLQANLVIDRTRAARLGVTPQAIDSTLYDAFGQRQIATMYTELDQFKVVLEIDPREQQDPQALDALYVPATSGPQVPLSAVTALARGLGPVQLNHQGQVPAITIGFNAAPNIALDTALKSIRAAEAAAQFPAEITGDFAGDAKAAQQNNSDTPITLLAAIVGVYLILGMLYESYAHPLTILSTIPSAGLGALLAMLITGTEFSVIAMIGLILLIGIVKKNAILMVDFALVAEREDGLTPRAAILQAARLRFRPITMTTLAAVLGALPIAIGTGAGSELRQPLGIAVIGGLLVSQVVTMYTTPAIYVAVDRLRGKKRWPRWLVGAIRT